MKLTVIRRLKICYEVLTTTSGHSHQSSEKQLSTFLKGYKAGMIDGEFEKLRSISKRKLRHDD